MGTSVPHAQEIQLHVPQVQVQTASPPCDTPVAFSNVRPFLQLTRVSAQMVPHSASVSRTPQHMWVQWRYQYQSPISGPASEARVSRPVGKSQSLSGSVCILSCDPQRRPRPRVWCRPARHSHTAAGRTAASRAAEQGAGQAEANNSLTGQG